ncbi:MAG: MFS transporter [Nanoarchaeota archaeon]
MIRSFAISLISLFIPLYLYKEIGYTLNETLLFFIFYSIAFAVTTPLAAKFSARFGMKHSILFSIPFFLVFIILMYLLPTIHTPLFIIGFFLGAYVSFYWMGFHLVFYHDSDHKHRGEEYGKRASFSIIGTMLGPVIGGTLIEFFGFYSVFILSSVLLFVSAFFLFLSKDNHIRYHFSIKLLFDKKYWRNSLFFISRGTYDIVAGVIWPLFIFFILNDYLALGFIGSIFSGISAVLIWLMGKYSDHIEKRKIIRWITGFESLSWLIRALVTTISQVFSITILGAVVYGIFETPIGALEYDNAKRNVTPYFVSREIFICLGRILLLCFVLITDSLTGGLIFHGFANLMALLF